jgi:Tfp pilus assembly protein PilX
MKENFLLKNENGSVLALALFMLALLTLLGIAVTKTAEMELQIAGNEKVHKENLFLAEAAAVEFAQEMENDPDLGNNPSIKGFGNVSNNDVGESTYWETETNSYQSPVDPSTRFIAVHGGATSGHSIDMTKSRVNVYRIYGRCTRKNALAIIEIGYRKAF